MVSSATDPSPEGDAARAQILRLLDGIEEVFSPHGPTPEGLRKIRGAVAALKDLVKEQ